MQIEAARIVIGVTRSISLNTLYTEIGWLTLDDRRTYQIIALTFKIQNNMVPDYLSDLLPRSAENPQYNLRQQNNVLTLLRTSLFGRSFIPSVIQQWNTLSPILRNIQPLGVFKRELLRSMFPTRSVPPHFMLGNKLLSIIHAPLRNNCSDLKRDLFLNHLSDHDICSHCCTYQICFCDRELTLFVLIYFIGQ